MRPNKLLLYDHSEIIGAENIAFCKKIQHLIDQGSLPVTNLTGGEQVKEDKPKLFGHSFGAYRVQEYVGTVTCEGTQVVIKSRFDQGEKQHFLNYAMGHLELANSKIIHDQKTSGGKWNFSPFIVPLFFVMVRDALSLGRYRKYHYVSHNDSRFQGVLDVSRHMRLNPIPSGKVAYTTKEYTGNNQINLLLLVAELKLKTNEATREGYVSCVKAFPDIQKALVQLGYSLPNPSMKQKDVLSLLNKTKTPIRNPLYQKYEQLRILCRSILLEDSVSLLEEDGKPWAGVVFSMDKCWENILEQRIFQGFSQNKVENQISILEGRRKFTPDIITKCGTEERAVFDAKNKPRWADVWKKEFFSAQKPDETDKQKVWSDYLRGDVFQIISYCYVMKSKKTGVLFPVSMDDLKGKEGELDYHNYKLKIYDDLADFYLLPIPIPKSEGEEFPTYVEEMEKWLKKSRAEVGAICQWQL